MMVLFEKKSGSKGLLHLDCQVWKERVTHTHAVHLASDFTDRQFSSDNSDNSAFQVLPKSVFIVNIEAILHILQPAY